MSSANSPSKTNNQDSQYKDTLTLPDTSFPMRGNLVQNEPQRLEKWNRDNLYQQIQDRRQAENAPLYVLHDGPPFANGKVHMGTALNKILKDFVLKSRNMAGYQAPYIPGWDCHGLPIEYKVSQTAQGLEPAELRQRCDTYAREFIEIQKSSFRRLGVLGDWDNPYLTLDPAYEADIIRVFGKMTEKELIYRSNKPVLWSYGAQTALAEAEVEYKDKKSPAITVAFQPQSGPAAEHNAAHIIWTTTPWTIPSNRAIAVHPRLEYLIGTFQLSHQNPEKDGQKSRFVLAADLLEHFQQSGWTLLEEHSRHKGTELSGHSAQHPLLPGLQVPILEADFVTADAGTGQVHIAPGHGGDDYLLGTQNNLEIFSPVADDGTYTQEIAQPQNQGPEWLAQLQGTLVFDANIPLIKALAQAGALVAKTNHNHSYPHCWRSKTPIIFRAVPQYFVNIEQMRQRALDQIQDVQWLPHWGQNRIHSTVENRPDWCISRQRTWGVPLPIILDGDQNPLLEPELIEKIAQLIQEHGSNLWFQKDDQWWNQQLGLPADHTRTRDTLDVWIDSGSSHLAVTQRRAELQGDSEQFRPADLYIEATDQHRGWFQSSLMLSVAYRDQAPYKTVITHGFVIDNSTGEKISKSGDKPVNAEYFYDKFGADIVRLWCSSVDYQNEVPFSDKLFTQVVDSYRRIRNTLRILLGNLNRHDPEKTPLHDQAHTPVDHWILFELNQLTQTVTQAYQNYDWRRAFNALTNFCTNQLSAHYIDITKDRLYCDAPDSPRRQASQAVFHKIHQDLTRLFAPILAYTADEAWEHAGNPESIHLQKFPQPEEPSEQQIQAAQTIQSCQQVRERASQQLEEARRAGTIGKTLEAQVAISHPQDHPLSNISDQDLAEYLIVSEIKRTTSADNSDQEITVQVSPSPNNQCPRCWRRLPEVGENQKTCNRCTEALQKH